MLNKECYNANYIALIICNNNMHTLQVVYCAMIIYIPIVITILIIIELLISCRLFSLQDIRLKFSVPTCFSTRNTMVKSENCILHHVREFSVL